MLPMSVRRDANARRLRLGEANFPQEGERKGESARGDDNAPPLRIGALAWL